MSPAKVEDWAKIPNKRLLLSVLLLMVAVLIVPYLIWSMRQEVER